MPKGYPDTVTCKNCGGGLPAEFSYCPDCGEKLPIPRWARKFKIKVLPSKLAPTISTQRRLNDRGKITE